MLVTDSERDYWFIDEGGIAEMKLEKTFFIAAVTFILTAIIIDICAADAEPAKQIMQQNDTILTIKQ
jgi:hypothetical protein